MTKIPLNEKLLLAVKDGDKKKFVRDQSVLLITLFAVGLIFRVIYSYYENETASQLTFNLIICAIIVLLAFSASLPLMWKANKELLKFPDKKNKKAMWLVILSHGMLQQGVWLPAVMTDYATISLGEVIFKHIFFMITIGLMWGYIIWDGWKTERLKELAGK